ncbi:uncharacterized protein STEHIDRAFT_27781, partial [Stereum hirsutum FP-91666 SS1]
LLTDGRPEEYQGWLKGKRQYSAIPGIDWLIDFAEAQRTWYRNMQPSWRCGGDLDWPPKHARTEGEINWGGMVKGGLNGFSLVLVGMVWW